MSSRRDLAVEIMKQIWDIHFPKGRAFSDGQFRLLCRDSFILADLFNDVGNLSKENLVKLGQPQPEAPEASPAEVVQFPAKEELASASV